jgi:hypothetical protein
MENDTSEQIDRSEEQPKSTEPAVEKKKRNIVKVLFVVGLVALAAGGILFDYEAQHAIFTLEYKNDQSVPVTLEITQLSSLPEGIIVGERIFYAIVEPNETVAFSKRFSFGYWEFHITGEWGFSISGEDSTEGTISLKVERGEHKTINLNEHLSDDGPIIFD